MARVRIYSTPTCGYCFMAKRLLKSMDIAYEEINVAGDADARQWLIGTTGQRTVPQIFVDDESIGGYRELTGLARAGTLDALTPQSEG